MLVKLKDVKEFDKVKKFCCNEIKKYKNMLDIDENSVSIYKEGYFYDSGIVDNGFCLKQETGTLSITNINFCPFCGEKIRFE